MASHRCYPSLSCTLSQDRQIKPMVIPPSNPRAEAVVRPSLSLAMYPLPWAPFAYGPFAQTLDLVFITAVSLVMSNVGQRQLSCAHPALLIRPPSSSCFSLNLFPVAYHTKHMGFKVLGISEVENQGQIFTFLPTAISPSASPEDNLGQLALVSSPNLCTGLCVALCP